MQVSGAAAPGLRGRRLRLGGTLALRSRRLSACPPQGYPPPAIPVLLLRAARWRPAPHSQSSGSGERRSCLSLRGSRIVLNFGRPAFSLRINFPLSPACSTLGSQVASHTPRAASCQSPPLLLRRQTQWSLFSVYCLLFFILFILVAGAALLG